MVSHSPEKGLEFNLVILPPAASQLGSTLRAHPSTIAPA